MPLKLKNCYNLVVSDQSIVLLGSHPTTPKFTFIFIIYIYIILELSEQLILDRH